MSGKMNANSSIWSATSLLLWGAVIVAVTAFYSAYAKNPNRLPPYQEWPSVISFEDHRLTVRKYTDIYTTDSSIIKDVDDVVCEYRSKEAGTTLTMLVWIRIPLIDKIGRDIIIRVYERKNDAWVFVSEDSIANTPVAVAMKTACRP